MNKRLNGIKKALSTLLVIALTFITPLTIVHAEERATDQTIVVSLGDSYSSGEGIEPFYGQNLPLADKVNNEDWLAHRSSKSWPSLLKVSGISGTMSNYKSDTVSAYSDCAWYFKASSGAETKHMNNKQVKKVSKWGLDNYWQEELKDIPRQLEVFNDISGEVDYVTLTMGGNDVDFADIITTCATKSTYLNPSSNNAINKKMTELWGNFGEIRNNIHQVYRDIQLAAGNQAAIIVAGYPKLLDKEGKGFLISKEEATTVNQNVTKFNDELKKIVEQCQMELMNIYFVDVESEFDKDGGHQAYSGNPWINGIMLGTQSEDLKTVDVSSAYSIHPNSEGAKAYARCVNKKIEEIDALNKRGKLSGKICKASDRSTPVLLSEVSVYKNDTLYNSYLAPDGNYEIPLPEGDYKIKIEATGYLPFTAYASIRNEDISYMETFLLVGGNEGEIGTANGTINNALTGNGIGDVTLTVREGWSNSGIGDVVTTTQTDANGNYSLSLPIGNYTLNAEKDGFTSSMTNIIVQTEDSGSQNGILNPVISGDEFRVVLTWGADPRDLDSHVKGYLPDNSSYHVYYSSSQTSYNGEEICNLDVDDTSSYGPETITLKSIEGSTNYYYIQKYAGSGSLSTSAAQVKVYQGENLVATFNVPTNQGTSDYWNVFAIVDGRLVVQNTITNDADLNYASDTGLLETYSFEEDAIKEEVSENDQHQATAENAEENIQAENKESENTETDSSNPVVPSDLAIPSNEPEYDSIN